MNIKNIFTAFALLTVILLLSSCEENVTDTSGLIYKEQIVVRAFLYASENAKDIQITRTVHPLSYPSDADVIPDADAYIIHNGQKYKLSYNAVSKTYSNLDIVFEEDETYQLLVKYKKLRVTATTVVPKFSIKPKLSLEWIEQPEGGYWCEITANLAVNNTKNIVFLPNVDNYNYNGKIKSENNIDTLLLTYWNSIVFNLKTKDTSKAFEFINEMQFYSKKFGLIGLDLPYWNYYQSSLSGASGSDMFGFVKNFHWNIEGDGIGLFIGCNKKEFYFQQKDFGFPIK